MCQAKQPCPGDLARIQQPPLPGPLAQQSVAGASCICQNRSRCKEPHSFCPCCRYCQLASPSSLLCREGSHTHRLPPAAEGQRHCHRAGAGHRHSLHDQVSCMCPCDSMLCWAVPQMGQQEPAACQFIILRWKRSSAAVCAHLTVCFAEHCHTGGSNSRSLLPGQVWVAMHCWEMDAHLSC